MTNVAADSLNIDEVTVADHGSTAVVVARVRVKPRVGEPTGTGRSRMMSVFVYDQQKWRLLARSITPCIERAVAAGRCYPPISAVAMRRLTGSWVGTYEFDQPEGSRSRPVGFTLKLCDGVWWRLNGEVWDDPDTGMEQMMRCRIRRRGCRQKFV